MLNILPLTQCQWISEKLNIPDAAADVFPSRIQSVWGGQRAAEQSSQSTENERHLNKIPEEQQLSTLSPVLRLNPSSELILLKIRCTLRGSVCPSSLHLLSPICPESSCASRAARAPGFPLPISWGSQSSFLLFSDVQNILKMVEHSLKKHKHTPPMSTFFPESIVDSQTGCDEERLRPPYKSLDSEKRWWPHVWRLTFLNICDLLRWSCVKNTEINLSFDFQGILFLKSYLKRKSKCSNSDHIKVLFPIFFEEKTFFI